MPGAEIEQKLDDALTCLDSIGKDQVNFDKMMAQSIMTQDRLAALMEKMDLSQREFNQQWLAHRADFKSFRAEMWNEFKWMARISFLAALGLSIAKAVQLWLFGG